ncbi:MAG TPA: serine/threonine-protein kinase [Gemmataceae bacterium]|jgi:tetratricopeptide (TPR) repeat protein/tRNA A-37 threonylcarbamoyl transferase component Bud32
MDDRVSEASEREQRLDNLATAYLKAQEAGQAPDRQALLDSNRDLASELREFFADQDRLERLAAPLRPLADLSGPDVSSTPLPMRTGAETAPQLPSPPRSFGDYTVLAAVGQGGMGVVWKARQKRPDRLVALKMFRAGDLASPTDVQRFRNEAEVIAQLDHPHILPVYEVGERDGVHYFSMKLVGGGSLADHLDSFRADPRAAARLLGTIARAVHYAHQRGILHRDLKPSNILLDAQGEPHVSDFGLAKRVETDSSLTQSGTLVGTPSYMAPEQTRSQKGAVTTATDVYGLGAVLYALLTGRPPFQGETVMDTLEQVREREPEKPSRLDSRVDRNLDTVCLKCLSKDPDRRYASAADLGEDLERWLAGKPVKARRAGRGERAWKWVRRNPALASLLAVVALSAATGVAGLVWHNERLRAEAEKTAQQRDAARDEQQRAAQVVDDMYTRVAEEWLGPRPRLQPLQREFLEKALEYYEHAAEVWSDDPGLRRKIPGLYRRVGTIQTALGRHDRAEESLRRAVVGFENFAAENPNDSIVRNGLLGSLTDLGHALLATRRLPEAMQVYRRTIELAMKLVADFPDQPELTDRPFLARSNLALALTRAGRSEEAESLYREALTGLDRLPQNIRNRPDVRYLLANTQNGLGSVYHLAGRFADAEPHYRQAATEFERLAHEFPANRVYHERWASALSNLGTALNNLNRAKDARPALIQAESIMDRFATDFPDLPDIPSQLSGIQINLASVLGKLGETGEAEKFYQKAIATLGKLVVRFPAVPEHRSRLGAAQLNLGNLLRRASRFTDAEGPAREAVRTRQGLASDFPEQSVYQNDLATALFALGSTLNGSGQFCAADEAYSRARGLQEKLLTTEPGNPAYRSALASTCFNLSLLLVWDQGPPYPRVDRALELAARAVELEPQTARRWQALGLAQFRVGKWRESLTALQRARELGLEYGRDHFFQAMAHWKLEEQEESHHHFDAGSRWLEKQASPDKQTLRLRDDAASMLGIENPAAGTKQKPPKKR